MKPLSRELALQLCQEIQTENRGKWYTFNGVWCLACAAQAKGDPARLCVSNSLDYRGCMQVNKRYEQRFDS
jgi:hypothetical protein